MIYSTILALDAAMSRSCLCLRDMISPLSLKRLKNFSLISDHHKYNNNYDYNKSIFLVNQDKHLDNGFLLLKNDHKLASPLAVLYYEEYMSQVQLPQLLEPLEDRYNVSLLTPSCPLEAAVVNFGQTQQPQLWDYADRVDTMAFLNSL